MCKVRQAASPKFFRDLDPLKSVLLSFLRLQLVLNFFVFSESELHNLIFKSFKKSTKVHEIIIQVATNFLNNSEYIFVIIVKIITVFYIYLLSSAIKFSTKLHLSVLLSLNFLFLYLLINGGE